MEAAFAELPLALFTTLAPMGAGAFIALALAFFTTTFTDDQVKKIDRMTLIPLVVVLVGFAASFFHRCTRQACSPASAPRRCRTRSSWARCSWCWPWCT